MKTETEFFFGILTIVKPRSNHNQNKTHNSIQRIHEIASENSSWTLCRLQLPKTLKFIKSSFHFRTFDLYVRQRFPFAVGACVRACVFEKKASCVCSVQLHLPDIQNLIELPIFGSKSKSKKRNAIMSQPMEDQSSQKVFGGCEGPDAMYVKLISSDGHEFIGMYFGL